ncbi:16S rRNA (cytidine(1402)-2'-O)-methyltransferase [Roseiterribacter gracilis]|uniref:Ribosomal RNA small subunit methyltransferase I n=1 Tax=Roseiterribacter gracilis TaxID=2812848 RepID=A0A8S8XGR4_9PROT|nr:ribosomal RNA small subunit methyltransferase I [Rhodospirillales bacterium TMPK1]
MPSEEPPEKAENQRPGHEDGDPSGAGPEQEGQAPPVRAPEPGLHLVATPIGNLRDITLHALDVLRGAALIACEDTRVTANLLRAYGIRTATTPYHEHNAEAARPRLLARLHDGEIIALVSDAGTPLVSDPGYKLVRACIEEGIHVTAAPGASAVLTALTLSGLPPDRFLFAGFLPPKSAARRRAADELAEIPASLIFYESGPRLADALADLAATLGDRPAVVARELTKKFEEVRRGTLAALAAAYAQEGAPRGEIAIVVAPFDREAAAPDDATIDKALQRELAAHGTKEAAARVAAETGLPRRALYARALELARAQDE